MHSHIKIVTVGNLMQLPFIFYYTENICHIIIIIFLHIYKVSDEFPSSDKQRGSVLQQPSWFYVLLDSRDKLFVAVIQSFLPFRALIAYLFSRISASNCRLRSMKASFLHHWFKRNLSAFTECCLMLTISASNAVVDLECSSLFALDH